MEVLLSFFQFLSSQQYTSYPPITAAAAITRQLPTAAAKRPAAAPSPRDLKAKGESHDGRNKKRRLFSSTPASECANMTSSATNGNTPTLPEDVSKPPEGVVLPPKDIRGWSPAVMLLFYLSRDKKLTE